MEEAAFVFSSETALNYDKYLGPFIFEPYAIDISSRLKPSKSQSVLEIASGTGRVTRQLRRRLPVPIKLVATDLNLGMLEVAKATLNDNTIDFRIADAQDLPFPDNSFDYVVCQFGLMFLPDKQKGFNEAYRVLKPGGKFLFSTWDNTINAPLFKLIFNDILLPFFNEENPSRFLVPFSLHNVPQLLEFLEKAKFKNNSVEKVHLTGISSSPKDAVDGFLVKHTLGEEVIKKDPAALNRIAEQMEHEIGKQFGTNPVICMLSALVGMGEK